MDILSQEIILQTLGTSDHPFFGKKFWGTSPSTFWGVWVGREKIEGRQKWSILEDFWTSDSLFRNFKNHSIPWTIVITRTVNSFRRHVFEIWKFYPWVCVDNFLSNSSLKLRYFIFWGWVGIATWVAINLIPCQVIILDSLFSFTFIVTHWNINEWSYEIIIFL